MPNNLAYAVLIFWPLVGFFAYRHFEPVKATMVTILGGYLILPAKVAIDFPLIPPMDKESIPALTSLLWLIYFKQKITLLPQPKPERVLVILLLLVPVFTVATNTESLVKFDRYVSGLTWYDGLSAMAQQYLTILPFIIGMQIVKTQEDQLNLFKYLYLFGLAYTVPIVFEIVMSPQLNIWFYGFFPHMFGQQMRDEGFRAAVFLGHGLLVGTLLVAVLASSVIQWRSSRDSNQVIHLLVLIFLLLLLIAQKSLTAIVLAYSLVFVMLSISLKRKRQLALVLIVGVILYPVLSIIELVPKDQIVETFRLIDPVRAESLEFRFNHEEKLIQHATEKPLFGWGGWGRNMLENSVTDGLWIIMFGQYGLMGFIALFGTVTLTVIRSVKVASHRHLDRGSRSILMTHSLLITVLMIDQIPNTSLFNWIWLFVGGLTGRALYLMRREDGQHSRSSSL